jgi:hypothetical protein
MLTLIGRLFDAGNSADHFQKKWFGPEFAQDDIKSI